MFKAILFDFDGTISDTFKSVSDALCKTVAPYKKITFDDICRYEGISESGMLNRFLPEQNQKRLNHTYKRYYKKLIRTAKPFDGIKELICDLRRQNIKTGLITGKEEPYCIMSLCHFNMHCDYFDKIETGSSVRNDKAEKIKNMIRSFGIKPEETAYVGDAPSDIKAANDAGVISIAAAWGTLDRRAEIKNQNPDVIFYSVEAFKKAVRNNNG